MNHQSITNIHKEIQQRFIAEGNPEKAASVKHYFKEHIDTYGVSATFAKTLAAEFAKKHPELSKNDWFDLCDLLWTSGKHEEGLLAAHITLRQKKFFADNDFPRLEEWVKQCVSNWAQCDTFCNHSLAVYLEKFPQYLPELKKWTKSDNRWVQRASAVTFCVVVTRGRLHAEAFKIAEMLLGSKDEMVQKGTGWLLKSIAESDSQKVIDFLKKHPETPRLIVRYATEKLSAEQKNELFN